MQAVVVDANIIFAAIRVRDSSTRQKILLTTHTLYCPNYLVSEIFKHKERIQQRAKASPEEILEFLNRLLQKIHFFNESLISVTNFIEAFHLCREIDEMDIPYVALALELNAQLWSRDDKLKEHLKQKGFDRFFDESIL